MDAMVDVEFHPRFDRWLDSQSEDLEIYGELMELINALERSGAALWRGRDECHDVVTSPYLFALRRTPPTLDTPCATKSPVIRMLFGLLAGKEESVSAVMLEGFDKSKLGNAAYPPGIAEAPQRLRAHSYANGRTPVKVRSVR
jgi:hypothetical protein